MNKYRAVRKDRERFGEIVEGVAFHRWADKWYIYQSPITRENIKDGIWIDYYSIVKVDENGKTIVMSDKEKAVAAKNSLAF